MSDTREAYEGWAIVELMGHRRLAGRVSEVTQYGQAMLRLDVPDEKGMARTSQYYGGSSIYCVTPCTEEIARGIAKHIAEAPEVAMLALPPAKRCDLYSNPYYTACSSDFTTEEDGGGLGEITICGRHRLEEKLRGADEPQTKIDEEALRAATRPYETVAVGNPDDVEPDEDLRADGRDL